MKVWLLFLGDLKELISIKNRDSKGEVEFYGKRSVKDLIESFGVPHTEVKKIIVNQKEKDFSYILEHGDKIYVYPFGEGNRLDVLLKHPAFICDVHLWKLARRMRLLGFDTYFEKEASVGELVDIAEKSDKIVLTRSRELLTRKRIKNGLLIRSTDPEIQVLEVIKKFNLRNLSKPFSRCFLCNCVLKKLNKEDIIERGFRKKIPEKVFFWCEKYNICPNCGKVFWEGTHYNKLKIMVKRYLNLN